MAVLSVLRADRALPPVSFLALISVRGLVDYRASVRLEGLGKFKPTMLQHAPGHKDGISVGKLYY
jgi:hypothetical protein